MSLPDPLGQHCPVPDEGPAERILLAHGEGGRLSRRLIEQVIVPRLSQPLPAGGRPAPLLDASPLGDMRLAFTTDAFTVTPLFFPGGDIGSLAVYGTANDLAVSGARPRWISLALVIEEGLPRRVLEEVLSSLARAAAEVGCAVVTGDTKVVPRGAVDQLFVVTSGVGQLLPGAPPGAATIEPGDVLLVTGPLGRHGLAVLAARERLGFDPPLASDAGNLWPAVESLLAAGVRPRAIRDATRGGVAAVLHEWASDCGQTLVIDDSRLPGDDQVRGACELLGMDPLHVACEGTMVVAVAPAEADAALAALRQTPIAQAAAQLGRVEKPDVSPVVVRSALGRRPLDEPTGGLLPRIC